MKKKAQKAQTETEKYIVGKGMPPKLIRGKLMPFRKMDGSTGYEFHGTIKDIDVNAGDIITRCGKRYEIKMR